MAVLNTELSDLARTVIQEMREKGFDDDFIEASAAGAILKKLRVKDESNEFVAVIRTLVLQVMKEQEPILQDCPYCQGKHTDIDACPLAPRRYAVVRAVKTEIQPGSSFFCYHEACWHGQKATLVETALTAYHGLMGSIRLVPLGELAPWSICVACHGLIAQPPDVV